MQQMSNGSFGFPHKRRWHFIYCVVFLSIVVTLFDKSMSSNAQAASIPSNSMVTIAVDSTSPSCTITRTVRSHTSHKLLSKTQNPCSAGTQIGTRTIPLSQAIAQHDDYVPSLPNEVSSVMKMKWFGQIQQLRDAKRKTLQSSSLAVIRPHATCNYDESYYTSYPFDGTWIGYEVYVHVLTNCSSIVLNREEVIGDTPVTSSAYWGRVRYVGFDKTCPLHYDFVGSNDLNYYPGVTVPAGYYNVWTVYAGNPCFVGNGGGYGADFSVGPLT